VVSGISETEPRIPQLRRVADEMERRHRVTPYRVSSCTSSSQSSSSSSDSWQINVFGKVS
jgi:hypothetical protein